VDKQHGVREICKTKTWIRSRQFLVYNRRGHGVHTGATVLCRNSNSQESQLSELSKERQIEALLPVEFQRLRLYALTDELANGFPQQSVFFSGVEKVEIESWHARLSLHTQNMCLNPARARMWCQLRGV